MPGINKVLKLCLTMTLLVEKTLWPYAGVFGSVVMKQSSSSSSCKSFKYSVAHLFSFPMVSDILIFAVHVLYSSPQVPPCLEQSLRLAVQAIICLFVVEFSASIQTIWVLG